MTTDRSVTPKKSLQREVVAPDAGWCRMGASARALDVVSILEIANAINSKSGRR